MYERSAIVLERYFNYLFGLQKEKNLSTNYQNYISLVDELEKYQNIIDEEEKVIKSFDEVATKIQEIQKKQEKLSNINIKLEEERGKLFNALDESPSLIEKKLEKIENTIENNAQELKKLKEDFIDSLKSFSDRQVERNKCSRTKRVVEANHISFIKQVTEEIQAIDISDLKKVKLFLTNEDTKMQDELIKIMMENGKNEKVKFNKEVIQKAVIARIGIAKKEAEGYLLSYDKMRRLLSEIDNDTLKLSKYQKVFRDLSVKFSFLEAEKNYIFGFLDNERMTAINGEKIHSEMMKEACQNFDVDMAQIKNLYELILREVAGKSTKKAYNELYNKTYLKDIEDKEKNFEEEVTHMKIQGTVINSNYWRIEGIKNLYDVFQKEVSEKFNKDLSEYKIEEEEEPNTDIDIDLDIFGDSDYEEDYTNDVDDEDLKNTKDKEDEENENYIDDEEDEYEYEEQYDEEENEDDEDLEDEYNSEEDLEDDLEEDDEEEFEDEEYEDKEDYEEEYQESEYDEEDENTEDEDNYEEDEEDEEDDEDDEDEEDDDEDLEESYDEEDEEDYDNKYEEDEGNNSRFKKITNKNYKSPKYYEDEDEEDEEDEDYEDDVDIYRNNRVNKRNRGNIDDRLAKYKEKMKGEKQAKGLLGFFKDRKR